MIHRKVSIVCWPIARSGLRLYSSSSQALGSAAFNGANLTNGRKKVGVALSGGVDSAVAALLLKRQGHEVFGVFMQNWDEAEEMGNGNCSVEKDLVDAQKVSKVLGIRLYTANFVREYWTHVFSKFVSQCERGLTPNPDLLCNKAIKFDLLRGFAKGLGADALATGHYARLQQLKNGSVRLLRAKDRVKDQSYFLASVPEEALKECIFPLGEWHKSEVRAFAATMGLHNAERHSSVGICFIGKRNFGDFISHYAAPIPGNFLDVDSGCEIGPCDNIAAVTYGQRAGPGGAPDRMFVAGKDIPRKVVYLALGREHPALFSRSVLLRTPTWIAGSPPTNLRYSPLTCLYKARYGQQPVACEIRWQGDNEEFPPSQYTELQPEDMEPCGKTLQARLMEAARALTPQQEFVMYQGDTCLGSAPILYPGPTLHEHP